MLGFFKRRRRNKLRIAAFPEAWRTYLVQKFPIYARLNAADRKELEGHIQVFLGEKEFEGCGGFEITDEVRVLVAAQACLLLLHRETDYYPDLRSVLIYPEPYVAKTRWNEAQEDTDPLKRARLGESWQNGSVVLAWSATLSGAYNIHDGHNVVLHEFAHQLDQETGSADGAPVLQDDSLLQRLIHYQTWARVLGAEYQDLCRATEKGRKTVMDKYGATNPAEFFAVATECFFEKPHQLKARRPELYQELQEYYQQDPANYHN
jgi:Mlc titration factor MtfA (ptsG expression regulator)